MYHHITILLFPAGLAAHDRILGDSRMAYLGIPAFVARSLRVARNWFFCLCGYRLLLSYNWNGGLSLYIVLVRPLLVCVCACQVSHFEPC